MVNRIYEIREGFHIDLDRIIAVRQFVDIDDHNRKRHQRCWIEVYMDCDQIVVIDCSNFSTLQEDYDMIVKAWQTYANESKNFFD